MRRGTLDRRSGSALSSAAHMIGSAAVFAPDTATSPSSARPPRMRRLSIVLPLLLRERAHGKRVELLLHAPAESRVDELMALHAALGGEPRRVEERLEMPPVAD